MAKETAFRLWLTVLLVATFLIVASEAFGQAITIDVNPKFALSNTMKAQTFRVLIRLQENPDNRVLSYSADCGANAYSTQVEADGIVYTKFFEMRVVRDCVFVASIHRIEKGKAKTYTTSFIAKVPEEVSHGKEGEKDR
jgi:hypothetical protein